MIRCVSATSKCSPRKLAVSAQKLALNNRSFAAMCNLVFAQAYRGVDASAEENLNAAESRIRDLDLPQNSL